MSWECLFLVKKINEKILYIFNGFNISNEPVCTGS